MQLSNWNEFKQRIEKYSALPQQRREQIIFRGQANHTWDLQTTLDRLSMPFKSKENREACSEKLIREFRNALHTLPTSPHEQNVMEHAELFKTLVGNFVTPTTDQEGLVRKIEDSIRVQWELIARHHGVPSPWLDWTKSPYVAAYFAFADKDLGDHVSIWILDREKFPIDVDEELWILDDDNVLRFNVKAIEQRSLFMRVEGVDQSVENLLGASLSRFDIPASERNLALDDLDEMLVNARSLFRDFHGAVSLAKYRVLQSWQ